MVSKKALGRISKIWNKEDKKISHEKELRENADFTTLFNPVYRPVKRELLEEEKKIEKNKII